MWQQWLLAATKTLHKETNRKTAAPTTLLHPWLPMADVHANGTNYVLRTWSTRHSATIQTGDRFLAQIY